jgi:exodeoxyribonuclease-3
MARKGSAMLIASWNVNSVRARLPRVLTWLGGNRPDVLCLQETKVVDAAFPAEAFEDAGYQALFHGEKTYNGVAILSRSTATEVARGFDDGLPEAGARLLVAELGPMWVASVYVPNGREVGSTHFADKLAWIRRLRAFLESRTSPDQEVVLCGDWNVTPDDRDVWDPEGLAGELHCHPHERAALANLCAWGLQDTFRLHHAEAGRYSWWDYRQLAFPKDRGLRIDLILASAPLAARCVAAHIDREARKGKGASDHTVITAEFD